MKIGIDMGGTNLRAALVDHSEIVKKVQATCPAQGTQDDVLAALEGLVDRLIDDRVTGIGAGIPSVLDVREGIVYNVANIPSWKQVPLKELLESRYHIPVMLNNDSNCFTLGVSRGGEGRVFRDFVGVTVGTGLGAGIIAHRKLYHGANTGAGELGALPYLDSDYEHYCSSTFFVRHYGMKANELSDRALRGDENAIKAWSSFGNHLGDFVKAVLLAYDPEAIILGGGIAQAFPLFQASMWKSVRQFAYPVTVSRLKIIVSVLEDAALLGAASLCGEDITDNI